MRWHRPAAADAGQFAFELYAPLELTNYLYMLNRDPSVIERGRRAVRDTIERARQPR